MPFRVARFSSSLNAIGGQRRPVQRTVRQQDPVAERLDQLGQPLGAGFDDLAGDHVPVDDDAADSLNVADTVDLPAPIPPVNRCAAPHQSVRRTST